jgi:hypothetical protein
MGRGGSAAVGAHFRFGTRWASVAELRGVKIEYDAGAKSASDELRAENLRKLFDRGNTRETVRGTRSAGPAERYGAVARTAGPVVVGVSPTGRTSIESGRHRLEVFREPKYRGGKLLVRFFRMTD